MNGGFRLLL